uniref:EGF-like domain-containing protein n=1 Tax=Chromera velia CCMP2878 TaxID=1169474 RepID=A0A0K6S9A8_9ALVE|eukprot:Cvel_7617.t1-p1 / transcript=Cvel_7617.t1 / gene=Cvel_7617 / organism=Chromera_velia_CCMP2878 / gene_product=Adhesive plaque matrix protein 2, putative / transcript_product=Adhesive plaque matrix protein 2, putative / location=Cvel_scaffold402:16877-20442(-) / protein_length=297 / sequence_SO=supercontig / SO=protein_coding / is_pseudo=false
MKGVVSFCLLGVASAALDLDKLGGFEGLKFNGDIFNLDKDQVKTQKNPCKPNPCGNGGKCLIDGSAPSEFFCVCAPGFSGDTCGTAGCDPNPCMNGGLCSPIAEQPVCTCQPPFWGPTCEESTTTVSSPGPYTAKIPYSITIPNGNTLCPQTANTAFDPTTNFIPILTIPSAYVTIGIGCDTLVQGTNPLLVAVFNKAMGDTDIAGVYAASTLFTPCLGNSDQQGILDLSGEITNGVCEFFYHGAEATTAFLDGNHPGNGDAALAFGDAAVYAQGFLDVIIPEGIEFTVENNDRIIV